MTMLICVTCDFGDNKLFTLQYKKGNRVNNLLPSKFSIYASYSVRTKWQPQRSDFKKV